MTAKADAWLALATRCEQATGPDRDIDRAIWWATANHSTYDDAVTASVDAILHLIGEMLPSRGVVGLSIVPLGNAQASIDYGVDPCSGQCQFIGATPALALCAAFCRAMARQTEERRPLPSSDSAEG